MGVGELLDARGRFKQGRSRRGQGLVWRMSQLLWLGSLLAQGVLKFALERVVRRPKKPPTGGKWPTKLLIF